MMQRRIRIFISVPLITVLLGIGGYFYISSDSFLNNFIKLRLEEALQKQVHEKYTVTFGKLSGNIFTGVEVENFRIEDDEKLPILSTHEIVLKYYFWGLLQRKFLVTALEINSPEFNLRRNSAGQVNLTQVFRESSQDSDASFAFAISKAAIKGGKIHFTDTQQNIKLSLPDIDIELQGKLEKWDHTGKLSIGKGSFALNGTELPIGQLKDIGFSVSATNSKLETLKLKLGNSFLEIQEFKGSWDERKWNTFVELTIDATDVQKFLGDNTQLAGLGKVKLDLNGTASTLNGTLIGTSETLSIKQIQDSPPDSSESKTEQVDIANLEIETTLNFEEMPQLTLEKFTAEVAGGLLSGSGSVTFDNNSEGNLIEQLQHFVKQPITHESKWDISDVQLRLLLAMFGELSKQIPQIESGTFTGTALINGNTTGEFHLDSSVKLSDTSFLVKDESIPLIDSSLDCKISSEDSNGSNVSIDGTIDDTNVDINGSFENLDVQLGNVDFGKLLKIFNTIPFKGIGSITAEIKNDGTATGHVEIPEAFYCHSKEDPIPLGRLAGDYRYENRVVYFENAHLTKQGGTSVSIECNVGIDGKLPANFHIVADPLVLDADYNKLFFTVDYPIEGNIKGELNLYGQLIDHLDGSGNFVLDSGNAWGINLDPATFLLEIDDYSLTIPNFVITTRGQQVILNVNVESNGDFNFSLKNSEDKPVQLAELARAADITDFPLDGKMSVNVESYQKKSQDLVFTTKFIFSDLTFEDNPLGDAYLDGILIEEKNHFEFIGKALAGTTDIEGTISNAFPNPYKFFLKSEKTAATPILRIFHPALDAITGTIDSTVEIEGTITELVEPAKKSVHPYDVDIVINETLLQYNSLRFTNPKPIRLNLEDDVLTISDSSLSVNGEESQFIELVGTIDTKTEKIDLFPKSDQRISLESFGKALELSVSGIAQYNLQVKGTLTDPIVDLAWAIPTLVVKTDVGDVNISGANGGLIYKDDTVVVNPFSMYLMDNPIAIEGNVAIHPNNIDSSKLNFKIISDNLDLAKFSDLVRNSLPVETVKRLTFGKSALIEGNIGAVLNVAGTVDEPVVDLNTHTIGNHPMRLGAFAEPIILDKLRALTTIRRQSIQIQDLIANGQLGKGIFQINGETSFSTENKDEMTFDLGLSVEKLEVGNFITFYQQHPLPISGTVSGSVKLTGTGFTSDLLTAICKINELNLQAQDYQIYNTSPIDFKFINNSVTTLLPLQIESSALGSAVNIGFDGPLTMPNITAKWQGTFKHPLQKNTDSLLKWHGNVEYANKQIKLRTELTTNGDNLILNGMIPFDLTLAQVDFSERFLETPIEVHLRSNELPLTFFPGIDAVLSEVEEGVVDIDLRLQGTTRTPYLQGNVNLQTPKIGFNNFSQSFENVTVQLKARRDVLEFVKFQFDIENGTCNLEQSELELDDLTPKFFSAKGLSIKRYPLGTILRQALPQDIFEDVNGNVAATLTELNIPLKNFFESGEKFPIPKIREKISFDALTQVATANFTIDNISLGFTVTTLDQQFSLINPEPIPITLGNAGTFTVNGFKFENTLPISSDIAADPLIFSCYGRWNMQGDIFANLKLDNFNISILDSLLPAEFRETYQKKGMLSTTIDIKGSYAAPEITVKCVGHELAINKANIDEFFAELQYSPNYRQWTISDKSILRFGGNQISCSGHVPYLLSLSKLQAKPLSEEMEVEIDFKLDELEILHLMEPLIQSASGIGSINATVSGTPQAPRLKGEGKFSKLKLSSSPVYFDNTDAQFNFTESKLEIETIEGQLNNGKLLARGEIALDWFEINDINLEASLTNCTFIEPRLYEININSDELRLHGKIADMILEGHIKIDSGYYRQDWNWEDVLNAFSAGTVREADLFSYAPILRELDLDVDIDIPNNFHLRSSTGGNTDIEIACSGQITGAFQEPLFTGNVSILNGKISIFTQVFKIVGDSTIRNTSTTSFNPELNIFLEIPNPIRGVLLSDGSTADLNISATVTGILENGDIEKAKLTLYAEPLNSSTTEFFTEADVLVLLFTPGNFFSRSFGGITFTITSGFDPNERHIIAEYPLPKNMSIKVEGDEKGEVGVDIQLLERRF